MPAPTASEQVNADYEAALRGFAMFKSDPRRCFASGDNGGALDAGLRQGAEDVARGATTVEDAIEKYYEAARGKS